jgi:S1-C subfamily serine protease
MSGFPNYRISDSGISIPGLVVGFRTISGLRRILTNASIIAGNSGGPVFDERSRVIGIAVTRADRMEEANETENHGIIPVNAINYL